MKKTNESLDTVTHTIILKNKKGITLIALVVTIVVLIILAAIAINLNLGNNGIFNKAKYAKNLYINASKKEEEELEEINTYIYGTRQEAFNTKVLWTNPNNTTNFTAKTISWGESNPSTGTENGASNFEYDYLEIEYYVHASDFKIKKRVYVKKGEDTILESNVGNNLGILYSSRIIKYETDTSLKFETNIVGYISSSGTSAYYNNWNLYNMPLKIIGIKL